MTVYHHLSFRTMKKSVNPVPSKFIGNITLNIINTIDIVVSKTDRGWMVVDSWREDARTMTTTSPTGSNRIRFQPVVDFNESRISARWPRRRTRNWRRTYWTFTTNSSIWISSRTPRRRNWGRSRAGSTPRWPSSWTSTRRYPISSERAQGVHGSEECVFFYCDRSRTLDLQEWKVVVLIHAPSQTYSTWFVLSVFCCLHRLPHHRFSSISIISFFIFFLYLLKLLLPWFLLSLLL